MHKHRIKVIVPNEKNNNSITVSTGIPGIVFRFLHLFYCIPCGLQGVPVANSYPVWSYVMIID